MQLHTYGWLRNSFRPPEEIRAVRTIWRLRDRSVRDAGRTMQQIQKALTTMNIRLANAVTDVSGVTGMAISEEPVARCLEGHWREEGVFELEQGVECYDFHQRRIAACDQQLQRYMAALPDREVASEPAVVAAPGELPRPKKAKQRRAKKSKNQPTSFDIEAELRRSFGVDLTRIDGIKAMTAQVILSEIGPDCSAFPSEGDFASWLELTPRRDITGGQSHPAEGAQEQQPGGECASESLSDSDSYLGARYRRLRGRMEGEKAIKAMAHYLAQLVYRVVTKGQEYVAVAPPTTNANADRDMTYLKRKAAELGLKLVPTV
jgi:transposase